MQGYIWMETDICRANGPFNVTSLPVLWTRDLAASFLPSVIVGDRLTCKVCTDGICAKETSGTTDIINSFSISFRSYQSARQADTVAIFYPIIYDSIAPDFIWISRCRGSHEYSWIRIIRRDKMSVVWESKHALNCSLNVHKTKGKGRAKQWRWGVKVCRHPSDMIDVHLVGENERTETR